MSDRYDFLNEMGFGRGKTRDNNIEKFSNSECLKATENARLIRFIDGSERWVPISQMGDQTTCFDPGTKGDLWVSDWIVEQWEGEKSEDNWVEIKNCVVMGESPKAIRVQFPDGAEDWIPLSQIANDSSVRYDGDSGTLKITRWLAGQKGVK